MDFAPVEPFVRHAAKTAYMIGNLFLLARDSHITYIISGQGRFDTPDSSYAMVPNTMIYIPYNTPYRYTTIAPMLFYTINFDFSQHYSDRTVSMTPMEVKKADPLKAFFTLPEDEDSCFSFPLTFQDAVWAENDLRVICDEEVRQQQGYREVQSAHMRLLLINMQRRAKNPGHGLCAKIRELVASDLTLNNKELAAQLNYHPYYLNEVFRRQEGVTLHRYILSQRLIAAHELVSMTQLSFDEIAAKCGFCSQAHFSTAFRKAYGYSPRGLRQ